MVVKEIIEGLEKAGLTKEQIQEFAEWLYVAAIKDFCVIGEARPASASEVEFAEQSLKEQGLA